MTWKGFGWAILELAILFALVIGSFLAWPAGILDTSFSATTLGQLLWFLASAAMGLIAAALVASYVWSLLTQ